MNKSEKIAFENLFEKKLASFTSDEFPYFKRLNDISFWAKETTDYFNKLRELRDHNYFERKNYEFKILDVIDSYIGWGSININNLLRETSLFIFEPKQIKKKISILEYSLNKFKLKNNLICIRLLNSCFVDNKYTQGNIFIEKAFLSTSLNMYYRLDEKSDSIPISKFKNITIIVFKAPKGLSALYMEDLHPKKSKKEEYELLINKGAKIKIISNTKIISNRIILAEILIEKNPIKIIKFKIRLLYHKLISPLINPL